MSKEIVLVKKNKKVELALKKFQEGVLEGEILEEWNETLDIMGILSFALGGVASFTALVHFDPVINLPLNPLLAILLWLGAGSSIVGFASLHLIIKPRLYQRKKFLKHFKEEDRAKLIKLIELNEVEDKLKAEYKDSPFLFIVKHLGDFNKDVALEVHTNYATPGFLSYLVDKESLVHKNLISKLSNSLKV